MTSPFAAAAIAYHDAGWWPLPLPASAKEPPPKNRTGSRATHAPSIGEIRRWIETGRYGDDPMPIPVGNICVRMPNDLIGIDVDVYGDKRGDLALDELERRTGTQLPGTYSSTARGWGESRIRFYRVPAGTRLRANPGDGIEIVQHHHRYAVVWPSVHPKTRTTYRWYDAAGDELDEPPLIDDLTELPWPWIDALRSVGSHDPNDVAATPEQVVHFRAEACGMAKPEGLKGLRRKLDDSAGSRHDRLVEFACWAAREALAGWYPFVQAEQMLRSWWAKVMDDGRRLEGTEFDDAIAWAVAQARAGETSPQAVEKRRQADERRASAPSESMDSVPPSTAGMSPMGDIRECPDGTAVDAPSESNRTKGKSGGKESHATKLVNLATARYRFAQADDGRAFAVPLDGAPIARPLDGTRASLRTELAATYFAETGQAVDRSQITNALSVLDGMAAQAERESLSLRVGAHGDRIVLDLGTPDGRCVDIAPGRVAVIERSPITFRRTELTMALPKPIHGGPIERLGELVNVTAQDLPLLVGWCLSTLFDIPRPILFLTGEQGTGKSTAAKTIVQLFDPSPAPLRAAPRDIDSWVVAAAGSQLVALDNLSHVSEWLSDALCRAATGEGLVKRALYTDAGLSVLNFRRSVVLTSIDAGALRGDLGERLVPVELEQITPDRRRTDAELDEAFKVAAPHLLGSLLDLAAAVLEVLPGIHVSNLPRMADFGRLLAALDEVKGWRSLDAYRAAVEQVAADVVAGDPLAAGIVEWMSDKSKWTGTATELLQRLSSYRPDGAGWPRTAKTMSGALARLAPALRGQGLHVTKSRSGTTRTLTIEHRSSDASDASDARPHLRVETREREEAPEERDSPVGAASRASLASSPPVEMF